MDGYALIIVSHAKRSYNFPFNVQWVSGVYFVLNNHSVSAQISLVRLSDTKRNHIS